MPTPTPVSFKRLSWDEMQKRRAQGLCFNYNERFTPGHKCQVPQLLILEGHTHTDGITCDEVVKEPTNTKEIKEIKEPEITLLALTRWTIPRTMRINTKIGSHEVVALIDSGSTHNFISDRIASMFCLPATPTKPFTVRVANGEQLSCKGRYEKVLVELQDTKFLLKFFSLPLTGLDMVLGIQWLETLGSVVCDWRQLTIDFIWEHQSRRLQGIEAQPIQSTTL
ncbi:hypothetical protein JRO89_XS03G0015000 [Xanthoceras sorbifolium]|uniref:RVP_2 domain-containing protein n=1 Tax=Xanthoceras sorbifolium TaxID=99658 RepID=A0ABQ8I830_9ROSI|nr:hypothetical protein JRO89_XS03G0015000 [Xanthoceras sorbifolium]